MATTTAQPSLDKQDPSGKPKSKLKRLVLLIVLVCAVAAAAAGGMYYFMVMQTEHGHPVQAPIPQPVFMQLDPLTVNLKATTASAICASACPSSSSIPRPRTT